MTTPPKKRGRPRKIQQDSPMDAPAAKEATPYHLTITFGNEVYQSEAPTLLEALQSLPRPLKITTKARLVLSYGERNKEFLYMPMMAKRLFYPLAQPRIVKTMLFGL